MAGEILVVKDVERVCDIFQFWKAKGGEGGFKRRGKNILRNFCGILWDSGDVRQGNGVVER